MMERQNMRKFRLVVINSALVNNNSYKNYIKAILLRKDIFANNATFPQIKLARYLTTRPIINVHITFTN